MPCPNAAANADADANANTGGSTIALPGLRPGELKMWEASLIFSTKNIVVFGYKVVKHLTSWPLNEHVKITMLWTTGPSLFYCLTTNILAIWQAYNMFTEIALHVKCPQKCPTLEFF